MTSKIKGSVILVTGGKKSGFSVMMVLAEKTDKSGEDVLGLWATMINAGEEGLLGWDMRLIIKLN